MSEDQPFEENIGGTVQVVDVSVSSADAATITSTDLTPSVSVTNPSEVTLFVRLDVQNITTVSSI